MKIDLNDVINGNTTSNQKNHMNLKEKNPPDLRTEFDKYRNSQPITHG